MAYLTKGMNVAILIAPGGVCYANKKVTVAYFYCRTPYCVNELMAEDEKDRAKRYKGWGETVCILKKPEAELSPSENLAVIVLFMITATKQGHE